MIKICVPTAHARKFERSMIENPMVEVISVSMEKTLAHVHYEIDAPEFFEFPDYAVAA